MKLLRIKKVMESLTLLCSRSPLIPIETFHFPGKLLKRGSKQHKMVPRSSWDWTDLLGPSLPSINYTDYKSLSDKLSGKENAQNKFSCLKEEKDSRAAWKEAEASQAVWKRLRLTKPPRKDALQPVELPIQAMQCAPGAQLLRALVTKMSLSHSCSCK